MNTALLAGILTVGVIRLYMAIKDSMRVNALNKRVEENQRQQQADYEAMRKEELSTLTEMAKDSGALTQMLKDLGVEVPR